MKRYTYKTLNWSEVAQDTAVGNAGALTVNSGSSSLHLVAISLRNKTGSSCTAKLHLVRAVDAAVAPATEANCFASYTLPANNTVFLDFEDSKALVLADTGDSLHVIAGAADAIIVVVKGVEVEDVTIH